MIKQLLAAALLALLAGFAVRNVTTAQANGVTSMEPLTLTVQSNRSLLVSLSRGWVSHSAHAGKINPSSTLLAVEPPHPLVMSLAGNQQVNLSDPIILSGSLTDQLTGEPVANKSISFSTNSEYLGQTRTDDQGIFHVQLHKDLPSGTYQVTATFKGAHLLAPTSKTISIEVLAATLQVQTVPAVKGITFQMDGRQFVSDENGLAILQIFHTGEYHLQVLLDLFNSPTERVEFGRWSDENYQPEHEIQIPGDYVLQVGLNIYHQVSMNFIDLDGLPVDASRISSIAIRSVQGDVFTLKPGDHPWLPASRTARRKMGLEVTNLLYSVNSVMINGSNVVNSAQQRFFAKPDDKWEISLLLYSLHITAKDGLFASPIGQSANITFPDGQVVNYPLNGAGGLDVHSLPRGIYHISLPGVTGLGTSTPVALSRNQVVNMRVVTTLDIAVVGVLSIGLALGLIFYGRPWLLDFIFKRRHSSSRERSDVNL